MGMPGEIIDPIALITLLLLLITEIDYRFALSRYAQSAGARVNLTGLPSVASVVL
jgi:hypothetical protein